MTASQAKIGSGDQFKEPEKRTESKGSADSTPDVTENIEEELDSFLNSDISDANDITKDETLANSDLSLKADYVEAIKHKWYAHIGRGPQCSTNLWYNLMIWISALQCVDM